ncbi:hypothetical protein PoB_000849900 [Plakobranchus ocellatus]|uniref:Uncharacterized protein n=1 Tax=Plakobranchus ocellatus TaxID=259542 RepID=A0AAV3YI96_9GAST|nr:hypothetical protein PoB_000849900 [Plakobranchus ocellatus]
MTDRAAVMKLFANKFEDFLNSDLDTSVTGTACNNALLAVKKEAGEELGRDKNERLRQFSKESETATTRLIRLACDCLGPRGDEKSGCRQDWLSFCSLKSFIPSFRSNRFNCFFEAAAALIFHRQQLHQFFNSGILPDNINSKLQSVHLDIDDDKLMSCICAIALFYLKITGPYWRLINSKTVKYFEFNNYVQVLHSSLSAWSSDPRQLLEPSFACVFGDSFSFATSPFFTSVHDFITVHETSLISQALSACCAETLIVTERQLSDFLGDGPYSGHSCKHSDETSLAQLAHCPLTNLIGEGAFGDFDFDCSKRRNASLHNRTSLHTVHRNKTMKFVGSQNARDRQHMFQVARKFAPLLRRESKEQDIAVKVAIKQKFADNQQRKIDRQITAMEKSSRLFDSLSEDGGLCKTSSDVDHLLLWLKSCKKSKLR